MTSFYSAKDNAVLSTVQLDNADLRRADLSNVYLRRADLRGARFGNAVLDDADLKGADLRGADLREAILRDAKNLTPQQIKSACNWEEAIYTDVEWNKVEQKWIAKDKQANQAKIEEIKQDKTSNPKTPPDCSKWGN